MIKSLVSIILYALRRKALYWMEDARQKVLSPGPTVVERFGGTFGSAKACMLLQKHPLSLFVRFTVSI